MERTDDAVEAAIWVLPNPPDWSVFLFPPAGAREGGGYDSRVEISITTGTGGHQERGASSSAGGLREGGAAREVEERGGGDASRPPPSRRRRDGSLAAGSSIAGGHGGGTADDEPDSEGTVAGAVQGHLAGVGSLPTPTDEASRFEGRYEDDYNPYVDLYKFGRPAPDFWYSVWMRGPLVLHDKKLLLASDSLGVHRGGEIPDLADAITDVLDNHPGPVSYFRVDSTTWTDDNQLVKWFETLSNKSVEEITLLNIGCPVSTILPISELLSPNLTTLRVGFMKILDSDLLSFEYSSLSVLQLIGCSYRGADLNYLVRTSNTLIELNIGYSMEDLTEIRCVSSIRQLQVGVNFVERSHRASLRNILEWFPELSILVIWRMDGIVYDEGSDVLFDSSFVGLGSVSCVKTRIQYFELEGFRGGPAEMGIARGILRHASRLAKFVLSHHKNYSEKDLVEQLEEIKTCIRASEDCIIEAMDPPARRLMDSRAAAQLEAPLPDPYAAETFEDLLRELGVDPSIHTIVRSAGRWMDPAAAAARVPVRFHRTLQRLGIDPNSYARSIRDMLQEFYRVVYQGEVYWAGRVIRPRPSPMPTPVLGRRRRAADGDAPMQPPSKYARVHAVSRDVHLGLALTKACDAKQEECAACLRDFEEEDTLRTMPCSHSFHEICLFRWLSESCLCPLCRYALPKQQQD
uniref:RING-type domain-containing protein n=1 Tax=Oryza meridionalis TaxID=40149 RepID=A0A0E0F9A0_9ORYZ